MYFMYDIFYMLLCDLFYIQRLYDHMWISGTNKKEINKKNID
jgi:hypothetical protein